ncbi:MAG: lmo0937 family membrane protein [Candidatus Paceibacterota bacterium]|jgi:hypothetical protein
MIGTIAIILLVLWLTGFIGFHIAGGLIHILLIVAIILIIVRLVQGE